MKKKIVLISCVKSKQKKTCSAEVMYTSPLFKKMLSFAKQVNPDKIIILSAKYGLLELHKQIDPYEQTLNNMGKKQRKAWADKVIFELAKTCSLSHDTFIFLAGKKYREDILPKIKNYQIPMKNLSFGKQLQWLDQQLK
jgi:cytoplasmic iron level regulating protein YaaA (DUF328/UPF0246 family)